MSEIKKYKKYLNFKANPRYLSRDFIVPLYTGTEPDIYEDKKPNINDQEIIVDPSNILPKNFTDDMPFAPQQNVPGQQLELADGGSVERQGFAPGGEAKKFSRVKTSKFKYPFTGRYGTIYYSKPIDYKAQSTLQVEKKYKKFKSYFDKAIEKEDYSYLNTSNRGKGKLPHHYSQELNKLKPGTSEFKIFAEKIGLDEKTLKEVLEERKKFVLASKSEAFKRGKLNKINDQKIIYETLEKGPSDVKTLSKKTGLTQTETKEELRKLLQNIYAQRVQIGKGKYALENKWSLFLPREENKIDQLLKNFSKTKGIEKIQKDTIGDLFYKAYGKQYLPDGKTLNSTYSPAKYNAVLNKLREYNTIRTALQNEFGINLELDHPLNRAALNNINATPDQLVRVNPITKELNRGIKEKLQTKYDKVIKNIKNAKGVELENLTKYLELETGKISSTGKVLKYGVDPFETLNMKKVILQNLENQNIIAQRIKTPEYAEMVKQAGVEKFKFNVPEVNTKDITKFFKDNPDAIKIARSAGFRCRKSVAGPIDVECLADDVIKQAEKGTTSAINKITKLANFARGSGSFIFDSLIGKTPGAAAVNFLLNIPFAISEAQEGKPGRQVLGTLTNIPFVGPLVGTTEESEITQAMGADAPLYFKIKDAYNEYQDIPNQLQRLENTKSELSGLRSPDETPSDIVEKEIELEKEKILKKDKELEQFLYPFTDKEGNLKYPKNIQKGLDILKEQERLRNLKTEFVPSVDDTTVPTESSSIEQINKQIEDLESKKSLYGTDIDRNRTLEDIDAIYESGARGGAARGGRIGFKDGTDDPDEKPVIPIDPLSDNTKPTNIMDTKLTRRQVIGGIGIAAGAPIIAKLMQEGKATKAVQAVKIASKIKIEPTKGMYPWFPKLVEKIKKMGKEFEEKELIMEPSYKNDPRPFISGIPKGQEKVTKHVDGDTTFILREYPDGRIAVDIDSPRNQQSYGQPVSLYYRPKMEFKNYKGETKIEPPEFKVLEPEPRPFVNGPDDVDITFTEIPKDPSRNIVYGDIEAAERFATGKIKNRKIIPVKQSLRNEMEEEPSTFIMRQSGELGSEARPEQIIKIPEEKATGGRVGFSSGGPPAIKIARLISEALRELKNSTSMVSSTARHIGVKNAKLEALTPYKNVPDENKHINILNKIEKTRENLPREYHSILDDIKKDVENFDYINADNRIMALDEAVSPELKFENLSKDIFPMEDPLNDAFIIIDPEKNHSVGRYIQRYSIDPETRRGIVQTFDTWDSKNQRFYPKGEEQLRGVESIEKGKEGLN
jgi:DNA-binding Lrp family transcriptional regulator